MRPRLQDLLGDVVGAPRGRAELVQQVLDLVLLDGSTIVPSTATPTAEPKLRAVCTTPDASPRCRRPNRLSASVLTGDMTRPRPAPVTSIPTSVSLWLRSGIS